MKPIIITISLTMTIFVELLFTSGIEAKEPKDIFSQFRNYSEDIYEHSVIEPWMCDSDYFYSPSLEVESPVLKIEDWMKDIHHFDSPEYTEAIPMESWMQNINHFYRGLTCLMDSRPAHLDVPRNSVSIVFGMK